jgi:hypothetical protein
VESTLPNGTSRGCDKVGRDRYRDLPGYQSLLRVLWQQHYLCVCFVFYFRVCVVFFFVCKKIRSRGNLGVTK